MPDNELNDVAVAGPARNLTESERLQARLAYLESLDQLRQEAGITAAMLRDGRAKEMIDRFHERQIPGEATSSLYRTRWLMAHNRLHVLLHRDAPLFQNEAESQWNEYLAELRTAAERIAEPA